MFKKILTTIFIVFFSTAAFGSLTEKKPKQMVWPFEGLFGSFDRQSAQRGAQVYFEVCSACHSMKHVYYRNLKQIGFSEEEIVQISKNKVVVDYSDKDVAPFERPGLPSDAFVGPYANKSEAQLSNNGAYPVDLSLIIKAREDGANYLFSLLTGYEENKTGVKTPDGLYYNSYFHGNFIAMPQPLSDDQVQYIDGTKATIEQMAKDVTIFLQWAAEPEMEERKSMGIKVMIFLSIFTIIFIIAKRRIWKDVK